MCGLWLTTLVGLGAGLFFITYLMCGVPGTMFIHRVGARTGMSTTLVLWGIASGLQFFINNRPQLYILRLVVGATEAGFFPSVRNVILFSLLLLVVSLLLASKWHFLK